MNFPLVSIVFPVWGVEAYVRTSFMALMEQTYPRIEYIIVDDATPDQSMEVIAEVMESYPGRRKDIRYIKHEKNRGLAAARASGLSIAQGEYVLFLDSDDTFAAEMVSEMMDCAQKSRCDLVLTDYIISYKGTERYISQSFSGDGKDLCKRILSARLQGFLWNKLIRRTLFTEHGIDFVPGVNMWEDLTVVPRICFYAAKIAYLPKAYVYYNQQNIYSYSNTLSDRSIDNIIQTVAIIDDFISCRSGTSEEFAEALNLFKLRAKFYCLTCTKGKRRSQLNSLYPETKTFYFFLKASPFYSTLIHVAGYFRLYFLIDMVWYTINRLRSIYIKLR